MKRKIAVVTTSRAEYGLLYWLIKEIQSDQALTLQLLVGGMHLSPEFGLTVSQVEQDGFCIDAKIEFLLSSDSGVGVGKSMGLAVISFVDALDRLNPDILVLLGDRYETLAVAMAATSLHIPIAHIHGGEITEGAIDDGIRHALTKLSHIHFPASAKYAYRILQMGEDPATVYNYGAPGLDHMHRTTFLSREEIEAELSIKLSKINILCTYHSVTTKANHLADGLREIFLALDSFSDATIIFTKSNSDECGRAIGKMLDSYVSAFPQKRFVFNSLGLTKYLSLAKHVSVVLGNSSSGLIEIPFVKTPTVNVGNRQKGRELSNSVICCEESAEAIRQAINKSLSNEFLDSIKRINSPYGQGDASVKIKEKLKAISLKNICNKKFVDYEQKNQKKQKNFCNS